MLLVESTSAGLQLVTGVLRIWVGHGEFGLTQCTLRQRGEENGRRGVYKETISRGSWQRS